MSEPGNLYIISAPSGTGKTTLVKALIDTLPGITVSVSHTTRPQRPAEIHGINYYFVDTPTFQEMIAHQDFLEHATVFKHYYGTSRTWVKDTLAQGTDVILEIDWQGCLQIQKLFPDSISIFILPPSLTDLKQRLLNRNQDKTDIIHQRLADVRETVSHLSEYNYLIINDNFTHAVHDLITIVEAGRLLQKRQAVKFASLIKDLALAK